MSVRKQPLGDVPANTARAAKGAFRKGNVYIEMADQLGTIYDFSDFVGLFSIKGQPALNPVFLVLVTILQYMENLSDRAAADSVRSRIDWKYLLRLDLEDQGFDHTVLSEFRTRLESSNAAQLLLDQLLLKLEEKKLLKKRGKQRTDSTHVLANIRKLNRLELVHETVRNTLETLATVAPKWIREHVPPEWIDRYEHKMFSFNSPKKEKDRDKLAQAIALDGFALLAEIDEEPELTWLKEVPAVVTLRTVWQQQFTEPPEPPRFREDLPSSERIASPHDPDARYSQKRSTEWTGYKVHLTETCDFGMPRLITGIITTAATQPDALAIKEIHQQLEKRDALPALHYVDSGYVSSDNLVESQSDYSVLLIGPTLKDRSWQALSREGFEKANFTIDWQNKRAICPGNKVSRQWTTKSDGSSDVRFDIKDCRRCPVHSVCSDSKTSSGNRGPRILHLAPQSHHAALHAMREYEKTSDFKKDYSIRSGIEGTISEAVRAHGIRDARYRGFQKTKLQHLLTAVAINFKKAGEWMLGMPLSKTRYSKLAFACAA